MNNVVNLKNLDSSIVTAEVAKEVLVVCMCEAFAVSCVGSTGKQALWRLYRPSIAQRPSNTILTIIVLLMVPNDYVLGEEQGRHWWNIEFAVLTKSIHRFNAFHILADKIRSQRPENLSR